MPHFHNRHRDDVILDRIQDAIVTLSDAVLLIAAELLRASRSRIVGQTVDTLQDTLNILSGNRVSRWRIHPPHHQTKTVTVQARY
jgi:hypothetical protein